MVIAESFERIHRSNLIGMGFCRWSFRKVTRKTLGLNGRSGLISATCRLYSGMTVPAGLTRADGSQEVIECRCRIDTATELTYYQNDGIFALCDPQYALNLNLRLIKRASICSGLFLLMADYLLSRWPISPPWYRDSGHFRVAAHDQRHAFDNVDSGFGGISTFFGLLVNRRTCSTLSS